MRKALDSDSKKVSSELSSDFQELFWQCNEKEVLSFMKLFWEEQQKYISSSSPTSIRYHLMIIKFYLNLTAKFVHPSLRTLRGYNNYIRPTRGFNPEVINELAKKTVSFSKIERNVTILFDEIKIQENLVWDKHLGKLIGFVV